MVKKRAPARIPRRAPGIVQTSIAVPKALLEKLDVIADEQARSRNSLIHWMLREKTAEYLAATEKGTLPKPGNA